MAMIANTTLPEDFVERVLARVRDQAQAANGDFHAAILAVLHRPLTRQEKWAIIDAAASNSPGVKLDMQVALRVSRGGTA